MRHNKKRVALFVAALTMSLTALTPMYSYADENVTFGVVNVSTVKHDNGSPFSVTNVVSPSNLDLDAVVQSAGLDALGEGNTPPDAILGMTPLLHYQIRNGAGTIIGATSSNLNTYLYNKSGFSQIHVDHSGIGRYYLRVYAKGKGWLPWQTSKEATPNSDDNDKIQALQLRIKGYAADLDDIYYKVVLNDGTVLDWARNGETTGTIGTDKYIVAIKIALWHRTNPFTQSTATLMESFNYEGVYLDKEGKVQYSKADGSPYTGWAFYNNEQYYFSEGSRAVGWQYINGQKFYFDESGKLITDLEPIMGLPGSYRIKYNKATKTLTVLAQDGNNGFIIPFKTFMTTNGPDTPLGNFNIYAKYRWKFMHDTIYCQFLSRFKGSFLFHSLIYYDKATSDNLDPNSYNGIDDAVSGGCVRLRASDAGWLFTHCGNGTPVEIYEDMWDKGPIERPAIEKVIPTTQHYDPTDPVKAAQHAVDQAARDAADAPRQEAIKAAQAADNALRASQRGVTSSEATSSTAESKEKPSEPISTSEPNTTDTSSQTTAPESNSTDTSNQTSTESKSESIGSQAPSSSSSSNDEQTSAPAQTSAPQ